MAVSVNGLCERFPRLYHMAHADAWASISRHGLLSTTALLDLFEIQGRAREVLESHHRPESVAIEHPRHGRAVIRDQKPMSEGALRKCLDGVTPREWYECLNGKVFFWLSAERLERLLTARAYRDTAHCVLTAKTAALVGRHLGRITLSPINSGSTIFNPQPRGRETFLPPGKYPFREWEERRGGRDAVAELAVDYGVPDIVDFVLRVEERRAGLPPRTLYQRDVQ